MRSDNLFCTTRKIVADGPPHQVLRDLNLLDECGIRPPALNHVLAGWVSTRMPATSTKPRR